MDLSYWGVYRGKSVLVERRANIYFLHFRAKEFREHVDFPSRKWLRENSVVEKRRRSIVGRIVVRSAVKYISIIRRYGGRAHGR